MTETSMQSGGRPSLPMAGVPQPGREEVLNLPRVHISSHPVMAHKMTALRDKNTATRVLPPCKGNWGSVGLRGYSIPGPGALSHRDSYGPYGWTTPGGRYRCNSYPARRSWPGRGISRGYSRYTGLASWLTTR